MSTPIFQYVVEQEHAGYTEEQIKSALLSAGYTHAQIADAFAQLSPKKPDSIVKEYAAQYLQQGASPVQAFGQLIAQGYAPGAARKAVNDLYGKGAIHDEHNAAHLAFAIIALLIGAGSMYLFIDNGVSHPGVSGGGTGVDSFSPTQVIATIVESEAASATSLQACTDRLTGVWREKCVAAVAAKANDYTFCSQITNPDVHDGCLLYFVSDHPDDVCAAVQLVESKETCSAIRGLAA